MRRVYTTLLFTLLVSVGCAPFEAPDLNCEANQRVQAGSCIVCEPGTRNEPGDDPTGRDTVCDAVLCVVNKHVSAHKCVECAPGSSNSAGDDASGDDTSCQVEVCETNEHVIDHQCVVCPRGFNRLAGDRATGSNTACEPDLCEENFFVQHNVCAMCDRGTSNEAGDDPKGGDTLCDPVFCRADEYVTSNTCLTCPPGSFNAAGDEASGDDTTCETVYCAKNEFVQHNICQPCAAGFVNEPGDDASGQNTSCDEQRCEQGFHVLANRCVRCMAGSTRPAGDIATGQDTRCQSIRCAEDEYVLDNTCVACPPGTVNEPGDDASMDNSACKSVTCPVDTFVEDNRCVPCAAGATNLAGDDSSGPDTVCDATLCASNQHVEQNTCVPCPPGATNLAGDDSTGENTSCDLVLCRIDERVQDNQCLRCQPGATNSPGDDATGTNTTCDATLCTTNEHVQNNQCVVCPAGSTNIAGDNATNSNTSCDPVLCLEDEYVQSNTCVACASDLVNLAGDSAAGPDTACDQDPCLPIFGALCRNIALQDMTPSASQLSDSIGDVVVLDGDTLAVGAPSISHGSGAVYVFSRMGTTWTQQAYIEPSLTQLQRIRFGASLALNGDTLVVGSPQDSSDATGINGDPNNNRASWSGAVWVFTRTGTTWTQQAYIKASPVNPGSALGSAADSGGKFGSSVAFDGDTLAVGAPGEDSNITTIQGSGGVYVFTRSGTIWTQQAFIKPSTVNADQRFGISVALDGDTLVAGSPYEHSHNTAGSAWVFVRTGATWTQQAQIQQPNWNRTYWEGFSENLALNGDTLVVGSPQDTSDATGINGDPNNVRATGSGAVWVFTRTGTTWTQQAYIKASNTTSGYEFGSSVALDDDTLVVGSSQERSNATNINGDDHASVAHTASGAAYVFTRTGTVWTQQAYIKPPIYTPLAYFGAAVAFDNGRLCVGTGPSHVAQQPSGRGRIWCWLN